MRSSHATAISVLLCSTLASVSAETVHAPAPRDVITRLQDGMVYDGKASGTRYLSMLGKTDNKLISTSFAAIGHCLDLWKLGEPCITFKLADKGQLDDMSDHPGATDRQRNFVASPDLDNDANTVSWNMFLERATAQPGFFHLGQIIGSGGPSWTMSVLQLDAGDMVAIVDATPGHEDYVCDSMSLKSFMSAPMAISVSVNRATQSLLWAVTNLKTRKVVMQCHRDGDAGIGKNSAVQGGVYRRVMDDGTTKSAIAHIGGFTLTNNHFGRLVNPSSKDD